MLAAKLPRLETVEVVEEPIPKPGKGEVLIQMKASALCRRIRLTIRSQPPN